MTLSFVSASMSVVHAALCTGYSDTYSKYGTTITLSLCIVWELVMAREVGSGPIYATTTTVPLLRVGHSCRAAYLARV